MADPVSVLINIGIQAAIGLAVSVLTPKQRNEGPRLENRGITTSTYGNERVVGYGTTILSGNVIWGQDLIEEESVQTQGGKGGPKVENVTYLYYANFAVALANREIDAVLRIYADGKRIYDVEADENSADEIQKDLMEDLDFTVYRGTSDQEPDPIIEAAEGEGLTPAYRGTAYIVFNRLPLESFGNRVPQFRFVVRFASSNADPARISINYNNEFQPSGGGLFGEGSTFNSISYNREDEYVVVQDYTGSESGFDTRGISVINPFTGEPVIERSYNEIGIANNQNVYLVCRGPWVVMKFNAEITRGGFHLIEAETLRLIDTTDTSATTSFRASMYSAGGSNCHLEAPLGDFDIIEVISPLGIKDYYVAVGGGFVNSFYPGSRYGLAKIDEDNGFTFIEGSGRSSLNDEDFPDPDWGQVNNVCQGQQRTGETDIYMLHEWGGAANFDSNTFAKRIVKHSVGQNTQIGNEDVTPTDWFYEIPSGVGNDTTRLIYDPISDTLLASVGDSLYAFDCNGDGTPTLRWVLENVDFDMTYYSDELDIPDKNIPLPDGILYVPQKRTSGNDLFGLRISDGEIVETRTGVFGGTYFPGGDNVDNRLVFHPRFWYDYENDAMISPTASFFIRTPKLRTTERLDRVVEDIVTRGKLTSSDIDVTALTTKEVRGYTLDRPMNYRDAVEPLATAFNFFAVEQGGLLVFDFHDEVTDRVVIEDDLIQAGDQTVLEESRGQELETPRALYVKHLSPESDDKIMVQGARRIAAISKTMNSVGEKTVDIPLYLTADEGAALAERILFESWVQRQSLRFRLPQRYLGILPNDVIDLTAYGLRENIRANRVSVGADLSMEIEGVVVDGEVYTAALPGVEFRTPTGYTEGGTLIDNANRVVGFHFDVPLFRDLDIGLSRDQALMYIAGAKSALAKGTVFPGASFNTSFSSAPYERRAVIAQGIPYGLINGTMPNIPDIDFNSVQEASVNIFPLSREDQFASVTEEAMITQPANAAMVLKDNGECEFINFRDVTEEDDGTLTLTGFLRAQRGTAHAAGNYSSYTGGVRLFLLNAEWIAGYYELLSRDGASMNYRFIPATRQSARVTTKTKTLTHQSLTCLAPANIEIATSGSNRVISWDRRTRINGQWNDFNDVPLAEDSESYEVDILDGSGGSVVRTLSSSSESVTYTSAQATTDFGGFPATLYVRVYQISAQTGRGFSYEKALTP